MSRLITEGFTHISIMGLGLMGGSLGLAIKRCYPGIHVTGIDSDRGVIERAIARNAVNCGYLGLREGIEQADLIFLATPTGIIMDALPQLPKLIAAHTIVTDLGSTKAKICHLARRFVPQNFIGGHPMAGSERQGIDAADPFLFENALYVLTPGTHPNTAHQTERLSKFLNGIGARVLYMDPEAHDRVVAYVSHLPQLLAVALAELAARQSQTDASYPTLAAGGFRDMTRIAASPYKIWADILADNQDKVERALDDLMQSLSIIKTELGRPTLGARFHRAAAFRNTIPRTSKGFLKPLYRLAVNVPDQPGVLAQLTSLLAQIDININDIELLKVRENVGGTFHIHCDTLQNAERAVHELKQAGYQCNLVD